MPRPRPPFVHCENTRHNRRVWYFRKGQGPRIRLPDAYGTPEFWGAYKAALAGESAPKKPAGGQSGSLRWLIDHYRQTAHWTALAPGSRKMREAIFARMIESDGDQPFAAIRKRDIVAARDRRTPFAGANFLKAVRPLFAWAVEAEYLKESPCNGVKALAQKTDGHHVWSDEEIEQFERRWPIGTRERLAFAILLYTGLRRGDAVKLGKQHVRNGVIYLKTEKTSTPVFIPMLQELRAVIDASTCGDLHYLVTGAGKPFSSAGFGNWFSGACDDAGVPGSAHGLRKAAATRLANAGATEAQLEAVFGWESGGRMAGHYTKTADRSRLAAQAMRKLDKPEA